jgi:hypothetical protein
MTTTRNAANHLINTIVSEKNKKSAAKNRNPNNTKIHPLCIHTPPFPTTILWISPL